MGAGSLRNSASFSTQPSERLSAYRCHVASASFSPGCGLVLGDQAHERAKRRVAVLGERVDETVIQQRTGFRAVATVKLTADAARS